MAEGQTVPNPVKSPQKEPVLETFQHWDDPPQDVWEGFLPFQLKNEIKQYLHLADTFIC